jgi:hypothetical protein
MPTSTPPRAGRRLAAITVSLTALLGAALIYPPVASADVYGLPNPACGHSDFSSNHGIRYPGGIAGHWDYNRYLGHKTTLGFNPETRRYEGDYQHIHFWRNETHGQEFVFDCSGA